MTPDPGCAPRFEAAVARRRSQSELPGAAELYDRLFAEQGGVCAICGRPPRTRRLHIDHDHATGEVRGLLCYACNRMLPTYADVARVEAALQYLVRHEGRDAAKMVAAHLLRLLRGQDHAAPLRPGAVGATHLREARAAALARSRVPAMNGSAQRCDGCSRMTYDVARVALLVAGQLRVERDLCAACRSVAIDGLLAAPNGRTTYRPIMRQADRA